MHIFTRYMALLVIILTLPATTTAQGPTPSTGKPLRVAIVGLVHGHAGGFLGFAR